MKKKMLVTMLVASLSMMMFAGCSSENSVSGDTVDVAEETRTEETEAEREIYMTIDAYGLAGGMLSMTMNGEEGVEAAAWGFAVVEGNTVGEILEAEGITTLDVKIMDDEDAVFEGWIEYKCDITTDEDGFDTYTYQRVSGETYYTTEELMAMPAPDYEVLYVAKWEHVSEDEYYMNYEMADDGLDLSLTIYANGGTIWHGGEEPYEADFGYYTIESGMTLATMMGTEAPIESLEMDGYTFTGWTVYTGETVEWVEEEAMDLDEMAICLDLGDYGYAVVSNYDVYGEYVSTEELYEIVCEGTNYIAIASWE